jgi:hypothetical protein
LRCKKKLKTSHFEFVSPRLPETRVARFFWSKHTKNIPNDYKLYQKAVNYTKCPQNIPKDHKI